MGNRATTIDEQIQLLRSRGLAIADESKAREILLDIGYYRLGFYWNCFEIDTSHSFQPDARFENAVKLYYMDVDLRELLLKYIYRIEVHFRTQLIYFVSNRYPDSPTWFVDPKVVRKGFIDGFNKVYNEDFKKHHMPIYKHHLKYINDKYAPAWKTIEFLTFGSVIKLFQGLNDNELKLEICKQYNLKKLRIFENLLSAIKYVRNMCSHGGVLFDLKQPRGITTIPSQDLKFSNAYSLDASIKAIRFLLRQISVNREIDLVKRFSAILHQFQGNDVVQNVILNKVCRR